MPGYAASKGGLGQLTKALANEWAGRGVQVNAIAPGYVRTDVTEALQNDAARYRSFSSGFRPGAGARLTTSRGRRSSWHHPASDFVNGEILVVDGGWMGR